MSDAEKRLREWLTSNEVYPNEPLTQAIIINSFYAEETGPDEDLISLEDMDLENFAFSEGVDQTDAADEDDEKWEDKVKSALNHPDDFLLYINSEWR